MAIVCGYSRSAVIVPGTILQIAPTPFFSDRGCHIRIEGIVRCLDDLGYENFVCTYHHGRDVSGINTVRIAPIKNYTQTAAGPNRYKFWADWKLLWLCVRQYRAVNPQIIHAHLHEGLLIGLMVKLLFFWRRTPLIADMQGSLTGELEAHGAFQKLPFLRWPTRMLERLLMWCADYIVCSSTHSLEKIRSEFNISSEKISLVQDGANPIAPADVAVGEQLKSQLGISPAKTLAVYSGALLDSKGLEELKSLIIYCSDLVDLHFLIIGYPVENLQPFLKKNKLEANCTLCGQIPFERLPQYLGIADIAIDPKQSDAGEGSGKILNYFAAGLPVVAFNTANNREFLPAGSAMADNVAELSGLLRSMHSNHSLRASAGKKNLAQFSQHFSWEATRKQLETAYNVALS